MLVVFHLNSKETKREPKVETLPFSSETKYLGVTLDRTLTYRGHLEQIKTNLWRDNRFCARFGWTSLFSLSRGSCLGKCSPVIFLLYRLSAGPSPGFCNWRGQKLLGEHIFLQYRMYAATGGPNIKWGAHILNGRAGHHCPPRWRRPWLSASHVYFSKSVLELLALQLSNNDRGTTQEKNREPFVENKTWLTINKTVRTLVCWNFTKETT